MLIKLLKWKCIFYELDCIIGSIDALLFIVEHLKPYFTNKIICGNTIRVLISQYILFMAVKLCKSMVYYIIGTFSATIPEYSHTFFFFKRRNSNLLLNFRNFHLKKFSTRNAGVQAIIVWFQGNPFWAISKINSNNVNSN
jgi:hypothetical protein